MIFRENRNARLAAALAGGLLAFIVGCSTDPAGAARAASPNAASAAEYQAAADSVLGRGAVVILSGDLAGNGHIQLLVANRLPNNSKESATDILISRAAVVEEDSGVWHEVLLADDSLKNSEGFLAGTPRTSVYTWRLRYEHPKAGLVLYFEPLDEPQQGSRPGIEVRWNRAARRYQSVDRETRKFQGESRTLTPPPSYRINR